MYTVVRQYSGPGAAEIFDAIEGKKDEVESIIRGVSGFVSYTLLRTDQGGVSVTVCQDKTGTDESVKAAADWVRQNVSTSANPPVILEGNNILQLN